MAEAVPDAVSPPADSAQVAPAQPPPVPPRHDVPGPAGDSGAEPPAPALPDREWETSPIYLALSTRLAKTESALASLSSQVAQLTAAVKSLSPPGAPWNSLAPGSQRAAGAQPVFSPFEGPDPAHRSPFAPGSTAVQAPTPDTHVAALTTQIAALSSSVAQLQRLQQTQSQSQLTRQHSQSASGPVERGPQGLPHRHSGLHQPDGLNVNENFGGNGNRPGINRSRSAAQGGEGEKWGPRFSIQTPRDWSPGPHGPMTPSVVGGGANNGNGPPGPGGAAAPGAGIVVTKWDHLNLKVELLRSISKYG